MKKIKISVIIPVYNSESTIIRCLTSIMNQTYENFEIIIIDDGSSDNSMRIIEKKYDNEKKIKIIKTDNHGVSHARNIGLDNMTGDYVVFVDSDDYIGTNMFYTLIEYVNKYKVDMVLYDSIFENSSGEFIKIVEKNITPNRILNKKEIVNNVLSWMYGNTDKELINNAKKNYKDLYMDCYNAPWQAMYKKSLIEDLRFDERLNIYEDLLFNVQIITKCNSLVYIDSALYHYVCNSSGSLATMYHSNYIEMKLLLYDIMKKNISESNLPICFNVYLNNRIVSEILSVLINEIKSKNSLAIKIKSIRNFVENSQVSTALINNKTERFGVNVILLLLKYNLIGLAMLIVFIRIKIHN